MLLVAGCVVLIPRLARKFEVEVQTYFDELNRGLVHPAVVELQFTLGKICCTMKTRSLVTIRRAGTQMEKLSCMERTELASTV